MNRIVSILILLLSLVLIYKSISKMSDNDKKEQKKFEELTKDFNEEDLKNLDPDNLIVNIGGKQVPFSKINKPHNVVLDPSKHKPQVNVENFPDLTPEAKKREQAKDQPKN